MVSQIVFRFGYMSSLEPDSCGQKKTSRFPIVSLEILKFFQLILWPPLQRDLWIQLWFYWCHHQLKQPPIEAARLVTLTTVGQSNPRTPPKKAWSLTHTFRCK
jgi:hypothetical protein